ncbi:hypothetical protein D3C78_1590100 [compost metagenome]
MRRVADADLRQPGDGRHAGAVQRDLAQRGGEGLRRGQGQAADRHPVRRPQQHHPADAPGQRRQARIGLRGHRAGIGVAGVRHDQRLGRWRGAGRRGGGQQGLDLAAQLLRGRRIEQAGDGGWADTVHGKILFLRA